MADDASFWVREVIYRNEVCGKGIDPKHKYQLGLTSQSGQFPWIVIVKTTHHTGISTISSTHNQCINNNC